MAAAAGRDRREPRPAPGRPRPGLIFGYATLSERAIGAGITLLAAAVSDVRAAA
jgi:hypothetical protein